MVLKVWGLDQCYLGTLEMQVLMLTQINPKGSSEGGHLMSTLTGDAGAH